MTDLEKAIATQLANIEKRTGKPLVELIALVKTSNLTKHGDLVSNAQDDPRHGTGDANTLVRTSLKSDGPSAPPDLSGEQVLDGLYSGPKAALRLIHDALLKAVRQFGDVEEASKKTYVSYRRKKQFAMIGPATNSRVEVGLNVKRLAPSVRLQELPAGQMCNYKVKLSSVADVDRDLIAWLRTAYDAAG